MVIDEMSREELIKCQEKLKERKNRLLYELYTKKLDLSLLQREYRLKIFKEVFKIRHHIFAYYNNKIFSGKRLLQEQDILVNQVTRMEKLIDFLFENDMDEYLFDPKAYIFHDQNEIIPKWNYDLELYEELEDKIPGIMDDYFQVKAEYCKAFPEIRQIKKEITLEDEIRMKQKLNLLEIEESWVGHALKKKDAEMKL